MESFLYYVVVKDESTLKNSNILFKLKNNWSDWNVKGNNIRKIEN